MEMSQLLPILNECFIRTIKTVQNARTWIQPTIYS